MYGDVVAGIGEIKFSMDKHSSELIFLDFSAFQYLKALDSHLSVQLLEFA